MKKSLISTLVATSLLSLSSMALAAEPATAAPVLLTASQMDVVTAGYYTPSFDIEKASVEQANILSPVLIHQDSWKGKNTAVVFSGNFSFLNQ